MRLGVLGEAQAVSGLGLAVGGPYPPVVAVNPCPTGYELDPSGAGICLPMGSGGSGAVNPSDNVYTQTVGPTCLSGQGPLAPGQVFCATACANGQAYNAVSGLCEDVVASPSLIPGVSNTVLFAGLGLLAILFMTGKR